MTRERYYDILLWTAFYALAPGGASVIINRIIGSILYDDRPPRQWDDAINELIICDMGFWQWVFLVSYIFSGLSFSIGAALLLTAQYGSLLGW